MQLGMIGLGKMGANMVSRLRTGGHQVAVWDLSAERVQEVAAGDEGVSPSADLETLCRSLAPARIIWVMVPAGPATSATLQQLESLLSPGDVVIDGGNSRYTDTVAMSERLHTAGIHLLDAGTSGGIWGLPVGYCLMVGGEKEHFELLEPALKTLAPPDGYLHVGPAGAGHYTKMVHNAIEYSMMQAYAEGFELLEASDYDVDLAKLSHLWNQGSVIRSWLLELAGNAFSEDATLSRLKGYVSDSGEGRWTLMESIDRAVPMPALAVSLQARFRSRQEDSFSNKVLAALRNQFGGHAVKKSG